jgi:uncharacterized protein DUF6804
MAPFLLGYSWASSFSSRRGSKAAPLCRAMCRTTDYSCAVHRRMGFCEMGQGHAPDVGFLVWWRSRRSTPPKQYALLVLSILVAILLYLTVAGSIFMAIAELVDGEVGDAFMAAITAFIGLIFAEVARASCKESWARIQRERAEGQHRPDGGASDHVLVTDWNPRSDWSCQEKPNRELLLPLGASTAMLVLAPFGQDYSYFMVLRILVSFSALYGLVYYMNFDTRQNHSVMLLAIVAVYNPIIPVHIGSKAAWFFINSATILVFANLYLDCLVAKSLATSDDHDLDPPTDDD